MRQSITTKYLGPTNNNGSRIKATARKRSNMGPEMSLTIPLDYRLQSEAAHTKAAKELAEKLDWTGLWIGGGNVDENGYVFVNLASVADLAIRSNLHGSEDRDWFYLAKVVA